jgi:hypothetical protein
MDNQHKQLFNSNYSFVKNNETFNKKLFDRNFLSSQMAQQTFSEPTYFNVQHSENRKSAEDIFNKRFANLNSENPSQGGKMGYVDFTDSTKETKRKSNTKCQFQGNYSEHIQQEANTPNLAYIRNSDRLVNNRSFLERKENKR